MNNSITDSDLNNDTELTPKAQKLLDNVVSVLVNSIMMLEDAQQVKDKYLDPETAQYNEMPKSDKDKYYFMTKLAQATSRAAIHHIENYHKID